MTDAKTRTKIARGRLSVPKGFITMVAATLVVVVLGILFAPSSVSQGAILGMLPFAAVLAIAGLGQMLVVQQGGIDLSIPGAMSLAIVIVSHEPNGDDSKLLPAVLLAVVFAVGAGLANGFMVGVLKLNSIIATLGTNALLFGFVLGISGGTPRGTTNLLASIAGDLSWGIPRSVLFAVGALVLVLVLTKRTVPGRRFEAIGANPLAARATGLRVKLHQTLAFVWAQLLYCLAGVLLAGITAQPTAFQGNAYLLPAVAVVVLGGTSLLGGRGYPVATVMAALFLSQLDKLSFALGVPYAARTLLQAAALTVGVALYSVDWQAVRTRLRARSRALQTTT